MKLPDQIVQISRSKLSGEQAYIAALVCQHVINALWSSHGEQMADFEARVFPDEFSPFGFSCNHPDHDPGSEDPALDCEENNF